MKVILADPPMGHLRGEAVTEAPNMGILYLISYVRRRLPGLEIHYLEPFLDFETHLEKTQSIKPDVYGISFATPRRSAAYSTIQYVRKLFPNALIIAGGAHPTADPNDVLMNSKVDVCVAGEGEETLCDLLVHVLENRPFSEINGIAYVDEERHVHKNQLRPLLGDIDFFPAWDLIDFANYEIPVRKRKPVSFVFTSRGCPNNCVFCSNPVWKSTKPWVRLRKPGRIAEEVEYLYDRGIREIYLRSDTFNVDVKWAIAVCEEIEKLELKDMFFQCNLRADNFNETLARKLNSINCWLVHLGIESANNRVLKGVNKGISVEEILQTCKILRKFGIQAYGFFMIYNAWEENNSPRFETSREVDRTLSFARTLLREKLIRYMSWSFANPIIGSRLCTIALKHNLLSSQNPHDSKVPLRVPHISEREMLWRLRKGLALQLWNGLLNAQINVRSRKRILGKVKMLLNA